MKSFMAKKDQVEQKWYKVDAEGKVLGRLAVKIANILMGKNKPEYTPHIDVGDYVVVVNADKVKLTGKKKTDKIYYHHSGFIGGLKAIPYKRVADRHPERVLHMAVRGMLPKTKLGRQMLKKLKIFAGPDHTHESQKPVELEL